MSTSISKKQNRKWLFSAIVFLPLVSLCQATSPAAAKSDFTNPLFWFMLATIVLLAFAISTLASAVKNISGIARHREKEKETREKNTNAAKITGLFLIFLFGWEETFGSVTDNTVYSGQSTIGGMAFGTFYFLLTVIIFELIGLAVLNNVMKGLLAPYKTVKEKPKVLVKEKSLLEKINASVDIEKEEDILMDHNYDGIQELDNNLPPWWKYGFYLTILVAVIYMFNYHLAGTGDLQNEELRKDIADANLQIKEYMKQSANNVDETSVKFLDKESDLASGKDLFLTHCGTCHGRLGEGGVGPNFADDYWLHGGSISSIFKSIKYGWTEKGMKSWKDELSPMQIAQVASFIKTLAGTNPPNQKAKQGELYIEKKKIQNDSLKQIFDTVKVNSVDTLKIADIK